MPKKTSRSHLAVIATAGVLAVACTKKEPEPAKPPEPVVFKAQAPIAVSFTLQKAEGQTGRTSPIGSNYRPQVRFGDGAEEPTCAVQLPASTPSLDPGQTSPASLVCDAEVRVAQGKREFTVIEGGKNVGQGVVQLP